MFTLMIYTLSLRIPSSASVNSMLLCVGIVEDETIFQAAMRFFIWSLPLGVPRIRPQCLFHPPCSFRCLPCPAVRDLGDHEAKRGHMLLCPPLGSACALVSLLPPGLCLCYCVSGAFPRPSQALSLCTFPTTGVPMPCVSGHSNPAILFHSACPSICLITQWTSCGLQSPQAWLAAQMG